MFCEGTHFIRKIAMDEENDIIEKAFAILTSRLREATISVSSSTLVENYLLHKLILEEREIFGALWLDVKNRLIATENIALGTLHQVQIFPREVLKSALKFNAANVIFFHNHPSGDSLPSHTDMVVTSNLKRLLDLIDVRLVDHIIVAGANARSFARDGNL
jgi:DNA repair protein RadC